MSARRDGNMNLKAGNIVVSPLSTLSPAAYWICQNNINRGLYVWVGVWDGAHVYGDKGDINYMNSIFKDFEYVFENLDTWLSIKDDMAKWGMYNIKGKKENIGNVSTEGW